MNIKCQKVIVRLDGKPVMVDQVVKSVEGTDQKQLVGGHALTVGEVLASVLTMRKVAQFNSLKSYALAQRFYKSEVTDVDEADLQGLRQMMDENEAYTPLVCAQVIQALIEAKEKPIRK